MPVEAVCALCKDQPAEPLPAWLVNAASLVFAFGHAGMWAKEELSRSYCRRHAASMIKALLSVVLVGAAIIGFGLRIWLSGP